MYLHSCLPSQAVNTYALILYPLNSLKLDYNIQHLSLEHSTLSLQHALFREITTLQMEIEEIMKGSFSSFMLKEIFEQPESVVNTMRGRVNFDDRAVVLGGIQVPLLIKNHYIFFVHAVKTNVA